MSVNVINRNKQKLLSHVLNPRLGKKEKVYDYAQEDDETEKEEDEEDDDEEEEDEDEEEDEENEEEDEDEEEEEYYEPKWKKRKGKENRREKRKRRRHNQVKRMCPYWASSSRYIMYLFLGARRDRIICIKVRRQREQVGRGDIWDGRIRYREYGRPW